MSATTFLRRRNYAGDTCKNEEFPAATFGKAFCNFRYLGVAKNTGNRLYLYCGFWFLPWSDVPRVHSAIAGAILKTKKVILKKIVSGFSHFIILQSMEI